MSLEAETDFIMIEEVCPGNIILININLILVYLLLRIR